MGFFGTLLLIGLGYVFWILIRTAVGIINLNSRVRNFWNNASSYSPFPPKAHTQPNPNKKKIDPSSGEYADYEDITVDVDQEIERQHTDIQFQQQSQISDADYEEIK